VKRVPDALGDAGRTLWRSVLADYELSPAELALLERASRTKDRLAKIDALIEKSQPLWPSCTPGRPRTRVHELDGCVRDLGEDGGSVRSRARAISMHRSPAVQTGS
jgi:hypothetical protein